VLPASDDSDAYQFPVKKTLSPALLRLGSPTVDVRPEVPVVGSAVF
jgi:hypothetical protein